MYKKYVNKYMYVYNDESNYNIIGIIQFVFFQSYRKLSLYVAIGEKTFGLTFLSPMKTFHKDQLLFWIIRIKPIWWYISFEDSFFYLRDKSLVKFFYTHNSHKKSEFTVAFFLEKVL